MCEFFSCVINKQGKVFVSEKSNRHEDILSEHGLDKLNDNKMHDSNKMPFARIEIIPPDDKDIFYKQLDKWIYKVDENIKPEWLNEKHEKSCRYELKKYYKNHVFQNKKIKKFIDKQNIYFKNYKIVLDNSSAELWGNSSAELRGNSSAKLWNNSSAKLRGNSSAKLRDNSSAELRDNSSVKLWNNSSVKLRGNSSAELWDNSSAELRGNSSVKLWNNSSAKLLGNSSAELWNNSSAELWDNSSAKLRDNSSVKLRDNSSAIDYINKKIIIPNKDFKIIRKNKYKKI